MLFPIRGYTEDMTDFGKHLKKLGISPADAALALGTTKAYIYMLSQGKVTPALRLAGRIEKWSKGKVKMQSWLRWAGLEL